jgi:nitrite reductase (NADH) large subunit
MKIGIVGAGHAGVSAAQEAIKYGAEITLFSEENFLPYYRPRITSVAFLQTEEMDIFMHPEGWYSDNKIKLVLATKIVQINTNEISLTSEYGKSHSFDKIIITTGAKPIVPSFAEPLILQGKVSPLWTIQDALTIRKKISSIKNIAVVGGGVIGIESALRALDAGLNVSIIEKAPRLMIRNLSPKASYTLSNILKEKGIRVIMNAAIGGIHEKSNGVEIETSSEKVYALFC